MLLELQPGSHQQEELDLGDEVADRSSLMLAMDRLNQRYGREPRRRGGAGAAPRDWHMKQDRRTPRYTTHWDEMAVHGLD